MLDINTIPKASLIVLLAELKAVNKELREDATKEELKVYKRALLSELKNRNIYVRE